MGKPIVDPKPATAEEKALMAKHAGGPVPRTWEDKQCGARNKDERGLCKLAAGHGTNHTGSGRCMFHGGGTPAGGKLALKEQGEKMLATFGTPRFLGAMDALLEELHRTAGHVAWLQAEVNRLDPEALVQHAGGGAGGVAEQKAHLYVDLYQKERVHFTKVAKTCLDAGIEDRIVKVAEETGGLIAKVLRGTLESLGVDPDSDEAKAAVRANLGAIESVSAVEVVA